MEFDFENLKFWSDNHQPTIGNTPLSNFGEQIVSVIDFPPHDNEDKFPIPFTLQRNFYALALTSCSNNTSENHLVTFRNRPDD